MLLDGFELFRQVQGLSESLSEDVIELRRHFHQYPEVSWQEYETCAHLTGLLRADNLEVEDRICSTGLTVHLHGEPGPTIAIRADMDALPIQDQKNVPYASKVSGVMHACGHDCHMAMAVGVAKVLSRLGIGLPGNVKFIFQPCEEAVPSGASELVNAGVMEGVNTILAFHVDPDLLVGKIGLRSGVLTAHCTEFRITLYGKSGHAARPHQAIDTIFIANQVMTLLYDIVGQRSQPFMPAVLTIGKVQGGSKSNIIPDRVEIAGTVRTIDEQSNSEILSGIEQRTKSVAESMRATCEIEFPAPVPSVYNQPQIIAMARELASHLMSRERIVDIEKVSMGGEDFSWYLTKAPGALIRLGTRRADKPVTHLHTSDFDIDESALPFGVSLMSMLVLKYLFKENLVFSD